MKSELNRNIKLMKKNPIINSKASGDICIGYF